MELTGTGRVLWFREGERELIEFRLPELGEGIESGQVIEVLVAPGDRVSVEQPLLEVETDKAAVEIPSPADGTVIEVCVSTGDTVGINQLLVRIDGEEKKPSSEKDASRPRPKRPRLKNPLRKQKPRKKNSHHRPESLREAKPRPDPLRFQPRPPSGVLRGSLASGFAPFLEPVPAGEYLRET